MNQPDDIVAVATPPGRGAISIVRLSGDGVPTVVKSLTGALPPPRVATLCNFNDAAGDAIDRGIVLYFPAPHSYTGEHALELHGHGSPVVMAMLLRRCVELGARLARPGEFSERAFLNGRLDLAQAEAVADLIAGGTEAAAKSAMKSLQGEFSMRINELVEQLTELRVVVEASIDFPEESVDFADADADIARRLKTLQKNFHQLRARAQQGKLLRDGLQVVLTGPPNAGKSSLLNALVKQQRAIVSKTPGTTRDLLDEVIDLDGLPLTVTDTAGIRDSDDEVEREGVRRARAASASADLILLVVDDHAADDDEAAALLKQTVTAAVPVVLVRNKIDLTGRAAGDGDNDDGDAAADGDSDGDDGNGNTDDGDDGNGDNGDGDSDDGNGNGNGDGGGNGDDGGDGDGGDGDNGDDGDTDTVALSALTGDGLDALAGVIKRHAGYRDLEASSFIARARHLDALARAAAAVDAAAEHINAGVFELAAEELAAAQRALGEVTGAVTSDDLLGRIFASFCIGK